MRTSPMLTVYFGGVYLPGLGGWTCLIPGGCTCLIWGCTCLIWEGVTCLVQGGVPARGCVPSWCRGVPAWPGGVPGQVLQPLWTESHTLVKILPWPKLPFGPVKNLFLTITHSSRMRTTSYFTVSSNVSFIS